MNGAAVTAIVIFAGAVSFVVFCNVTYILYGRLWFTAFLADAPVPLLTIVGMSLRKVRPRTVVDAYITAKKAGVPVTILDLERHCLEGRDVARMVDAMAEAKNGGRSLSLDDAATYDSSETTSEPAAAAAGNHG